MKNIKITTRLMMGFSFAVIVNIISSIVGCVAISGLVRSINAYQDYIDGNVATLNINSSDLFWKDKAGTVLGVCLVIGVVITIAFEVALIHNIRESIKELAYVSGKIAEGDSNFEFRELGNNEFGDIMEYFRQCGASADKNAKIAAELANGNLSIEVVPNSENDILGNALKKVVDDNNDVLSMIKRASLEVNTGAGQVAAASQSLAQGSTEQASAIEQVTVSIQDITAKTQDNAEQANEANKLVQVASRDAESGNACMVQMKTAMKEINASSENISKIIKVIDDIAFQTNILALNAAVEAARAGSYGKGFAVVAEEVRDLASKSSQAATETAAMIEDSINKVRTGTSLAEETAVALDHIVKQVEKIVDITSNIAEASNNQAAALEQVDQAIVQVSQVVQTNSATSEECAAASEELSSQATNLLDTIDRFKLKQISSYGDYAMADDEHSKSKRRYAGEDDSITLSTDFGKY